jgi:hypothetical protein
MTHLGGVQPSIQHLHLYLDDSPTVLVFTGICPVMMQGRTIPRLLAHGILVDASGEQRPFLATEKVQNTEPLVAKCRLCLPKAGEQGGQAVAHAALRALHTLHDLGVVHNSIHEGNLLLEYTPGQDLGQCKVWLLTTSRGPGRHVRPWTRYSAVR